MTLLILTWVITITVNAQHYRPKLAPIGLSFLSGASKGLNETLSHHYDRFEYKYPGANPYYWNPSLSWTNKYKNNDPKLGEKFLGSSTIFVFTTDAYHLTNTIHKNTLFAAGITIGIGERRPWWHYALDAGISMLSYSAGFHAVYTIHFK